MQTKLASLPNTRPYTNVYGCKGWLCVPCNLFFNDVSNVGRHNISKHRYVKQSLPPAEDEHVYACRLDIHHKLVYCCKKCDRSSSRPSYLNDHWENVHTNMTDTPCDGCGAYWADSSRSKLTDESRLIDFRTARLNTHRANLCPKRPNRREGLAPWNADKKELDYSALIAADNDRLSAESVARAEASAQANQAQGSPFSVRARPKGTPNPHDRALSSSVERHAQSPVPQPPQPPQRPQDPTQLPLPSFQSLLLLQPPPRPTMEHRSWPPRVLQPPEAVPLAPTHLPDSLPYSTRVGRCPSRNGRYTPEATYRRSP